MDKVDILLNRLFITLKRRMILKKEFENFNIIKKENISRRAFLRGGALAAVGGLILPNTLFAEEAPRTLKMFNIHTGKKIDVTYYENGEYNIDAMNEIYDLMADYRANEVMVIDNQLIDLLHYIQKYSGQRPIELLSGYRSPHTNYELRLHHRGVAKHSYHMYGKAADIRIPKLSLRTLRRIALHLSDYYQKGGVGYYPRHGFVHVDVGPLRRWRG